MKDTAKLILSLGLVCAIGSLALTQVYQRTQKPIEEANKRALNESLKLVLPPETATTEKLNDIFFKALDAQGKLVAYAGQATGTGGFHGNVKVLVGLSPEGKILGVMVTEHGETPGLGSKATDRKSKTSLWSVLAGKAKKDAFPPNPYLDSFNGRQATGFKYGKGENGVQGVSGATLSSKAILRGVNTVCKAFKELPKENN